MARWRYSCILGIEYGEADVMIMWGGDYMHCVVPPRRPFRTGVSGSAGAHIIFALHTAWGGGPPRDRDTPEAQRAEVHAAWRHQTLCGEAKAQD